MSRAIAFDRNDNEVAYFDIDPLPEVAILGGTPYRLAGRAGNTGLYEPCDGIHHADLAAGVAVYPTWKQAVTAPAEPPPVVIETPIEPPAPPIKPTPVNPQDNNIDIDFDDDAADA